jgi:hypothetical protein
MWQTLRPPSSGSTLRRQPWRTPRQWRGSCCALNLSPRPGSKGSIAGAPVLTVAEVAVLIGRSYPQTNAAIDRLVSAGILTQATVGRRNRAFEAADIINAFTDLERQLASPGGDTRISEPVRPVPPRRPASTSGLHDKPK